MEILFYFFAAITFGGGIGYVIGKTRSRGSEGFLLGLLLGPIGWIITLLIPAGGAKCPECMGDVPYGARRCKNCGVDFGKRIAPAPDSSAFFVIVNDKTQGPFTLPHLRYLIKDKKITRETLCAKVGDTEWIPVGDFL